MKVLLSLLVFFLYVVSQPFGEGDLGQDFPPDSLQPSDLNFPGLPQINLRNNPPNNTTPDLNDNMSLGSPDQNETPQQLLARFSDPSMSTDTATQREVQSTIAAEGGQRNQIFTASKSVLPSVALTTSFDWTRCFFKKGLTWKKINHYCPSGLEVVGCSGCNPYNGDTQCYQLRPILCIYRAQDVRPDYITSSPFYNGWSGGHLKITKPIRGCYIFSKAHADNICRSYFGFGWGIASHHDGHYIPGMTGNIYAYSTWNWGFASEGGWNFYAYGNVATTPYNRYWVYIRNQPGNCWN